MARSGGLCSRAPSSSRSEARPRSYGPGDTYYVPDSVAHSAVISPGFVGIDVFADADRYQAREGS